MNVCQAIKEQFELEPERIMTALDLIAAIDAKPWTIRKGLLRMHERGELSRLGHGRYQLASDSNREPIRPRPVVDRLNDIANMLEVEATTLGGPAALALEKVVKALRLGAA